MMAGGTNNLPLVINTQDNSCVLAKVSTAQTEPTESATDFARRICSMSVLTHNSFQPDQDQNTALSESDFIEDISRTDKLPITCRDNHAFFYKSKLGSGKKGKCIKFEDEWYTPFEFEYISGLEMSKDWKRSLRYGGRSLLNLINKGLIRPHSSTCMCAICCGDKTVMGPIRYAVPKTRRKRRFTHPTPDAAPTSNDLAQNPEFSFKEQSSGFMLPAQNTAGDTDKRLDISQHLFALVKSASTSHHSKTQELFNAISEVEKEDHRVWSRLHKKTDAILEKVTKLQETIRKTKEECDERRNKLLKDMLDLLKQQSTSSMYVSAAKSMRFDKSVEDQEKLDDDTQDDEATEICRACGRLANSECTGCRKATYCSTRCQEKDWNAGHKDICRELSRQNCVATEETLTPDDTHERIPR